MAEQRLARDERRRQLLDVAAGLIRESGTDALTLATVAERAGVSKPVAYEHFETRAGLLKALFLHLDAQMSQDVEAALRAQAHGLNDVVGILSAAYVDCVLRSGREYGAIAAALAATRELEAFRHGLREDYVARYGAALRPFAGIDAARLRPLLIGWLAAADELALEASAGRLSRETAVETLAALLSGGLSAA